MDLERNYSGILIPILILATLFSFLLVQSTDNQTIVYVDDFEIVDRKIHLFNDEHKIEIIVDKKDYNNYQILIDKKAVNLKLTNPDELLENSRLVNSGLMDVEISYHFEKDSDKVKDIGLLFVKRYSSTYSNNNFW